MKLHHLLPSNWHHLSVKQKLLVLALIPLVVVFPLLLGALIWWGNTAFDQLLITKVRSDLAVAHGYFRQVLNDVGSGTQAVAASHALMVALDTNDHAQIQSQLAKAQDSLGFDFVNLYDIDGTPKGASAHAAAYEPPSTLALETGVQRLSQAQLLALAPHLQDRLHIALIPTEGAIPTERTHEDDALVMLSSTPVLDETGRIRAWLRAGVLLNQNIGLIDHINQIVYPDGSLPLGSVGTATLFMADVRITTNVRLFQDKRAIGTRVSKAVHDAVLVRGETWLDRAFVVNDWYVSGYEPLIDAATGKRVGMLYVGYLETPYRMSKYGIVGLIIAIFAAAMVVAGWFSIKLARTIFHSAEVTHLIEEKTHTLQRWGEELDARVAQRTQELLQTNQSLQRAQNQLVKSEKLAAIGQLTASMAHEINNPIAVLQGNLDLVREIMGHQIDPVRSELKLMDQQVDRIRLIVTQLLQYARPNDYAGYVEAVDVNATVRSSLVLVEHQMARTNINIQLNLTATEWVQLNRQELSQVLINLMINAIQAMPHGGILDLHSCDRANDENKPGVLLEVSDSGAGLTPVVLERLFSPFFTTKKDGNGLGLWVSLGLVERYGGNISAENRSREGDPAIRGAIFRVWLPKGAAISSEFV